MKKKEKKKAVFDASQRVIRTPGGNQTTERENLREKE